MIEHSTGWSRFALLTHEGDVVRMRTPGGEEEIEIVKVTYV